MNKPKRKKRFVSLNLQLTGAVILGILIAAGMYFVCTSIGHSIINVRFLSPEAVKEHVGGAYDSLETFIRIYDVKGTDNDKLTAWLKTNENTYLYVYDNFGTYFEAGWSEEPSEEGLQDNDMVIPYTNTVRINYKGFHSDVRNRIIEFNDQDYCVYIDTYGQNVWYELLDIVTIVICFISLLTVILIYNARVLRRVRIFSEVVQQVSGGDFDAEIKSIRNDEIGRLAENVNTMRNSIIQKHEGEKRAWEANGELITAMSHDIRSPLTSIIGYLDIIEDQQYKDEETFQKYIEACRSKAFQLKDLSDKLFQYFLVFGNQESDLNMEMLDASLLFQQILGEHNAEIMSYGFKVDMEYDLTDGQVNVDVSGIRRLFNNVFSNISKYADNNIPIKIIVKESQGRIFINIINNISKVARKVESTKIGLKTCQRICDQMKGTFIYEEDKETFTVRISFPLHYISEEESEEDLDGEENTEE